MAKIKLTKSAVDAAQAQAQAVELRDTLVPGFLCKVTPAGRKVFMLQYRTNAGERRKPALGQYGELTVEQARSLAQEWLAQVRRGGDPAADKAAARKAPTVSELCKKFMEDYSKLRNKPSTQRGYPSERMQLALFRALPSDMAPRDAQDLMAYPFFSLSKSRRTAPIDFRSGDVSVNVEGTHKYGIATIWDADILIWAASQIVAARDAGLSPSRLIQGTPYEILRFIGRGVSQRDYQRLKAALDRLQSTTIETSLRCATGGRLQRFSWISEWHAVSDARGIPQGIELILPEWFYAGVLDAGLVLTIDPAYFRLSGGIERWLYRVVRKHGGHQPEGWRFTFAQLYRKSGSIARYYDFAADLRVLVAKQSLPGYVLGIEFATSIGADVLTFRPV